MIDIKRIERALRRWGPRFEHRIFTSSELDYCRGRLPELAARFAGKEAVSKALGTGLRGIAWRDIEILPDRRGKPEVHLRGRARDRAEALGLKSFAISLSHTADLAVAFVVASPAG